jgi:OMF family outer membrane factor
MVSPLALALLEREAGAQSQPAAAAAVVVEPSGPQDPAPQKLPLATQLKGSRPKSNPTVLPPAATVLPPDLRLLQAPLPLALPNKPTQVTIRELRPLGLTSSLTLAEVNNPNLKALAIQVQEAQSALRAQISLWYPQLNLRAGSFPAYTGGEQYSNGQTGTGQERGLTSSSIWRMGADLEASWALINPGRNPQIAAARDQFEQAKNSYLIGLRDLRLQVSTAYFDLQQADEQVRIGQESVRSSQVSLRDARARFQAGVATKLEVLQAETQLARDQQLLTNALYGANSGSGTPGQSIARRSLAALLSLPQDVTPTAKDPSRVIGTWLPTLQESIVAAYAFREELDQIILDISVANSNANAELAKVQPFLNIVNTLSGGRTSGYEFIDANQAVPNQLGWTVDNTVGLNLRWNIFDGGGSQASYRRQKLLAEEKRYRFSDRRNSIREEVEKSFYELESNNRNITTTSREVLSARESLRLARLRFQAGVTTQREVVDTQRDLTQAEVRYSNAIADYNKGLASLQRRTGLDQISICPAPSLPANKPVVVGATDVPVEVQPLVPACQAKFRPPSAAVPSLAP